VEEVHVHKTLHHELFQLLVSSPSSVHKLDFFFKLSDIFGL
jgi:hypothetical protein